MKNFNVLSLAAVSLAVAGCGGSGTSTPTTTTPTAAQQANFSAAATDTIQSRATAATQTATSATTIEQDMAQIVRDWSNNQKSTKSGGNIPVKLEITQNASGDGIVTLIKNGKSYPFNLSSDFYVDSAGKADPYSLYKKLANGDEAWFWTTMGGTWEQYGDGTRDYKYMVPVGMSDCSSGICTRSYGVLGLKTDPANMPTSSSALYKGRFFISAYNTTDPDTSTGRVQLRGDSEFNVNFAPAGSTVSGKFNNLENKGPGDSTYSSDPVTLTMASTPITGNGFTGGNITFDAASCASDCPTSFTTTADGSFYGNSGQELGGSLTTSFTVADPSGNITFVGNGNFSAKQ